MKEHRRGPLRSPCGLVALATAAVVLVLASPVRAVTVHVDARASGANDGSSWDDAFTRLSDALQVAGSVEIWVAEGRYTPAEPGGSRSASFELRSGQALYGGFAGTETMLEQRDPAAHRTVLSGDLNGDDIAGSVGGGDNSYHVVTANGADATTVLDGLSIQHGSASAATGSDAWGGGLLLVNSSPRIAACRFLDNFGRLGGAVLVFGGQPLFTACTFRGNRVQNGRGGAVYNSSGSTVDVTDCTFEDNAVSGGAGANDGGAVFNDVNASATITRCVFAGNSALSTSLSIAATGGAISHLGSRLDVINSTFRGQTANTGGAVWLGSDALLAGCVCVSNTAIIGEGRLDTGGVGGALTIFSGVATIVGCTLSANFTDDGGGVYTATNGELVLENSILWANRDSSGSNLQSQLKGPGAETLRYSCVQDLLTPVQGEDPPDPANFPGSIDQDPFFVDPDGPDNIPGTADDDLRPGPGSPCIDAGDNAAVPASLTADVLGNPRFLDDPATVDTGAGTPPIVDMGAYEFGGSAGPCSPDTTPPTIACPGVPLAFADANCEATLPDLRAGAVVSDDCTPTGSLVIDQTPAPGTLLGQGAHLVTLVVSDGAGNTDSCTLTWSVEDRAFLRGNINTRSAHLLDLGDLVDLVSVLFAGFPLGFDCQAALDVNNDGMHNISDVVALSQGVFGGNLYTIPAPSATPGVTVVDGGSIPSILGCLEGENCP